MKSRIIPILAIAFLMSVALGAQTTSSTASVTNQANGPADVAGFLYAANFAHWTASPTDMGTRWTSPGQCYGTSGGLVFPLFSTTAPITIVDVGVPANTETVTPTNALYTSSGCSVALPATHPHSNYYLKSGTVGLQEALNWIGSGYAVVELTADWTAMGGTTSMLTSSRAGANTTILDSRTSNEIAYYGTTPTPAPAIVPSSLQVGSGTPLPGAIINATQSNVGTSTQINVQNTSVDNAASSDLVATADNGTNTTFFLDCGINSSTYNQAAYNSGGADDGYCYATNNFFLGAAGSGKSVTIGAGGTTSANVVATFASALITFAQPLTPSLGINGLTAGVAAGAGIDGQVISSLVPTGSGVSIATSGTTVNMSSISLTAGDWDVEGSVNFVAGSTTIVGGALHEVGFNTTSATLPVDGSEVYLSAPTLTTTSANFGTAVPRKVYNVSSTTVIYLVASGTFTAGTEKVYGTITARRIR